MELGYCDPATAGEAILNSAGARPDDPLSDGSVRPQTHPLSRVSWVLRASQLSYLGLPMQLHR